MNYLRKRKSHAAHRLHPVVSLPRAAAAVMTDGRVDGQQRKLRRGGQDQGLEIELTKEGNTIAADVDEEKNVINYDRLI